MDRDALDALVTLAITLGIGLLFLCGPSDSWKKKD